MTSNVCALDRPIRFGTRGSALALVQTDLAVGRLRQRVPGQATVVRIIRTEGDIDRVSPLTEIGGRGVFTNALEREILAGGIDGAVHSAKDLPTALHPGVPIIAFPDRDDPRDVLISRHQSTLDALPTNPVIGTSSRRREAQIMRLRPDARIRQIRGNIDTRVQKALSSEFDAVVLAAAGILRMGWGGRVSEYFDPDRFVPSPGQGAIAVQARAGTDAADLLATIDEPSVSTPVRIERAFLAAIGAGCTMPVGAYASASGTGFQFAAMLANESGGRTAYAHERLAQGNELEHVAEIAAELLAGIGDSFGGGQWVGVSVERRDLTGARVVVTRPRLQAGRLLELLSDRGAEALELPMIRTSPVSDTGQLDASLTSAATGEFDWMVFTSANAVSAIAERLAALRIDPQRLAGVRVAAVGRATASAANAAGFDVELVPAEATGEALGAALRERVSPGARILHPRSAIGRDILQEALWPCGVEFVAIDAYETHPERDVDPRVLQRVRWGEVDAVTFSSPSSVRNLVALLADERAVLAAIPAICAGPVTADAALEAGLTVGAISADPGPAAMVEALAAHWCNGTNGKRPNRGGLVMSSVPANEGSAE